MSGPKKAITAEMQEDGQWKLMCYHREGELPITKKDLALFNRTLIVEHKRYMHNYRLALALKSKKSLALTKELTNVGTR